MPPELADVDPGILAQYPWLLWLVPISIVVTFLITTTERIRKWLGPFGAWLGEREERKIERRRRQLIAQGEFDDARLADAEAEIAYLKRQREEDRLARQESDARHNEELAQMRREIQRLRTELVEANKQITEMLTRKFADE